MWSRSNPQRDQLLSLCQEPGEGEQESRVLPVAVARRDRAEGTADVREGKGLPARS